MVETGFDDPGVFFSDPFGSEGPDDTESTQRRTRDQQRFADFIRNFVDDRHTYKYRDQLRRNYNLGRYWVEISLNDMSSFDEELADKLGKQPTEFLPLFELAAREVADDITKPRPDGDEEMQDVQVILQSEATSRNIRQLKSEHMAKLVKISGIIISASSIRSKAVSLTLQCRSCKNFLPNIAVKPGLEGYALPRKCTTEQAGRPKCPMDPFYIVPDKCRCVDFQVLKLQESPDSVPTGEIPRHMQLYVDRYLVDKVVPGNRVTVTGIYSIKKSGMKFKGGRDKLAVGIRHPYLRIVGISVETEGAGRTREAPFTPHEETEFRRLAADPNIYETLANSIAPSIYGGTDIKKAIVCLLFGGSRKRLPDGLTRRGDINLLLLGDPGTAKSQLLKFVEKASPVGVYTSGKGSSAAGLTASVIRDPLSRNFIMEGGAMVLADGGVVCIDEFDKMREDDRVAIHEAMEQQTISIAKAGITTTLNSRCSVLAAANSVFGSWDDTKGDQNLDFMPTILSRFDMIFIIKDRHDEEKDTTLAKHVMKVHLNAPETESDSPGQGKELSIGFMKKFISYCRSKCGPRLSPSACEKLQNRYVLMRGGAREHERVTGKKTTIPITVRQLEAIIRIAEAIAKLSLCPFATDAHVDEALRLFQVSTLDAAATGTLSGVEGFSSTEDQEEIRRVERQLKQRFPIGSQVSEQRIIQDFLRQKYAEAAVTKVIQIMLRRGELQHRMQRKVLFRIR
eukprot:m.310596 g.310596  ORF g.310596 m.310596 type:complete len:737 (+) comp52950_c0_seq1:92-2302(+)